MAIMIDKRPQYGGEGVTWDSFSRNLPNDVVVYTHREVIDGDECDFALLIKNRGILITEVKGWRPEHIYEVTNDGHVILTNQSPSEKKVQSSPREQARKYRFQWLNYIQDRLGISPLILHMVCYPFLSEKVYREKRLDIVSDRAGTLFGEDLRNQIKLGQKIDNWFNLKKGILSVNFDDVCMAKVRQCFESSFQENRQDIKEIFSCYSLLKIYGTSLDDDLEDLIEAYFEGTKIIVFVRKSDYLERIAKRVQIGFEQRKIVAEGGNIRFSQREEIPPLFYESDREELRIFNLEAYYIKEDCTDNETVCIVEGQTDERQHKILEQLEKATNFNYGQYLIEHALPEGNVLVRAGAGTGKTYSMVSRIAFLCNARKAAVQSLVDDIAMVTFTNDAADNMKVRLKQSFMNYYLLTRNKRFLYDIESVDLMRISTIHKFAKSMLQTLSVGFGIGHDFSITSSSFIKEQIYEKYLNSYLIEKERTDPSIAYRLRMPVHKFRKLLMNFTKQLYDKSCDIKTISPEEVGSFDAIPFFNDIICKVMIPAEEEYHESIMSKNKIDLKESMILLHMALENGDVNKCGMRYKYLFIDEFQDTDDIQIDSFLKLQEWIPGLKLFLVGDIKQSIYRFRGATDSAFEQVRKKDSLWREYSLTRNYRTDKKLLEELDEIFSEMGNKGCLKFIRGEDTLKSNLFGGLTGKELIRKIEYHGSNKEELPDVLFKEIQYQKDKITHLDGKRKIGPKEKTIAILVRENWQIEKILMESKKRNCYIETEIGGELYQLTPTIDLYKLVMALMNPEDPAVLFNLIKSNYVNLQMDIQGLYGVEKNKKTEILTNALNRYFAENLGKSWTELITEIHQKPVLVVLRDIYEGTQPWQKYDEHEEGQRFYKSNYDLMLEKIIKVYSVDYLSLNVMGNSLHINILTGQEEQARNAVGDQKDIRVICTTVHKAKGLEYGTVILPYCDGDISTSDKSSLDVNYTDHKLAFGMKLDGRNKEYNSNYDKKEESSQRIQEESRVLYVALTRAIRNIVWLKNTDSKAVVSWQKLMEE